MFYVVYMDHNIISLKQAREQGLQYYFTGVPCKHGHTVQRRVRDRSCMDCRKRIERESHQRERERDPEKNRERCRNNYQKHKDAYKARARKWEINNPERSAELQNNWRRSEKGKAQSRNWVAANKEVHAGYSKSWKERHPELVYEYVGTRRATKLNATPPWLTPEDREEIRTIYKDAKSRYVKGGPRYQVDHIIPLQGENVCGLHVPWNLQILTESENSSKSNQLL